MRKALVLLSLQLIPLFGVAIFLVSLLSHNDEIARSPEPPTKLFLGGAALVLIFGSVFIVTQSKLKHMAQQDPRIKKVAVFGYVIVVLFATLGKVLISTFFPKH